MRAIPTHDHHPYKGLGFELYLKAILKNKLQLWDKKVEIHTFTFLILLVCIIEHIDQFYIRMSICFNPLLVLSLLVLFLYRDEIKLSLILASFYCWITSFSFIKMQYDKPRLHTVNTSHKHYSNYIWRTVKRKQKSSKIFRLSIVQKHLLQISSSKSLFEINSYITHAV